MCTGCSLWLSNNNKAKHIDTKKEPNCPSRGGSVHSLWYINSTVYSYKNKVDIFVLI